MIAIDTHSHVYPKFSLAALFAYAEQNILENLRIEQNAGPEELKQIILCVCDRVGLPSLRKLMHELNGEELSTEKESLFYSFEKSGRRFGVLESKQWGAKEGFEVLGLGSALQLPDRLSAEEYIQALATEGAVAVLPWSPGKWSFSRAKVLESLVELAQPASLLLGDVYIRPALLPRPSVMQQFSNRGGRIIYGSDPLPFAGEERNSGSYVSLFDSKSADGASEQGPAQALKPLENAADVRDCIRRSTSIALGRRSSLLGSGIRTFASMAFKSK